MMKPRALFCLLMACVYGLASTGCVTYRPRPFEAANAPEDILKKSDGKVHAAVEVLDPRESARVFGVPTYKNRVQPVWVRIRNDESDPYFFLMRSVDEDYYSAAEAAFVCRFATFKRFLAYGLLSVVIWPLAVPGVIEVWSAARANKKMTVDFREKEIGNRIIAPGEEVSGFVFTTLAEGRKLVNVDLIGEKRNPSIRFIVDLPGVRLDYMKRPFEDLYPEDEIVDLNSEELRAYLRGIPRATTNKRGTREGDPMNLVVVGKFDDLRRAFFLARWDETESMYLRSALRTAWSSFFGSEYRLSPISSLYVFGRPQDIAFQKARESVHQRHHLRLWYTPKRFEGKPVWVGQASRDIGVKFTLTTIHLTTHKIDPDVDDSRDYVMGDLLDTDKVSRIGYLEGVGKVSRAAPRKNLGHDPYYTDGLRAVAVVEGRKVTPRFLKWQ